MENLSIGDKAPLFECVNQENKLIKLTDYIGKKIVLFFYPKASTPGCTKEACNLNENLNIFTKKGYKIIGVSVDTVKKQANFSKKYGFKFHLLADENKKIVNNYKVWQLKKFMGREYYGIVRTTFIINEKGFIENIISKVKTTDHTNQILNS